VDEGGAWIYVAAGTTWERRSEKEVLFDGPINNANDKEERCFAATLLLFYYFVVSLRIVGLGLFYRS